MHEAFGVSTKEAPWLAKSSRSSPCEPVVNFPLTQIVAPAKVWESCGCTVLEGGAAAGEALDVLRFGLDAIGSPGTPVTVAVYFTARLCFGVSGGRSSSPPTVRGPLAATVENRAEWTGQGVRGAATMRVDRRRDSKGRRTAGRCVARAAVRQARSIAIVERVDLGTE